MTKQRRTTSTKSGPKNRTIEASMLRPDHIGQRIHATGVPGPPTEIPEGLEPPRRTETPPPITGVLSAYEVSNPWVNLPPNISRTLTHVVITINTGEQAMLRLDSYIDILDDGTP